VHSCVVEQAQRALENFVASHREISRIISKYTFDLCALDGEIRVAAAAHDDRVIKLLDKRAELDEALNSCQRQRIEYEKCLSQLVPLIEDAKHFLEQYDRFSEQYGSDSKADSHQIKLILESCGGFFEEIRQEIASITAGASLLPSDSEPMKAFST
jgi:hypothetical protein